MLGFFFTNTFDFKKHENQKDPDKLSDKLICKNGVRIIVDVFGKGKLSLKVRWKEIINYTLAEVSVKATLGGHIGVNSIYGYDEQGPYMQQEIYFSGLKGSFEVKATVLYQDLIDYSSDKQNLENGKIADKTAEELQEQVLEPYVFQTKKFYPLSLNKDD